MKLIPDWMKKSLWYLWEGFLKNLGVYVTAFILSGGYLVALNKIAEFQLWVRSIPTDWVLTPFVILLVVLGVLVGINIKQRKQIVDLQVQDTNPVVDEGGSRYVTHYGVWWKITPDMKYIEDFPYCPCCEKKTKLVQTEWHPDEAYKCPTTNTEIKLYDVIPMKREGLLQALYNTYFFHPPIQLEERLQNEVQLYRELHEGASDDEILNMLFTEGPLKDIPEDKKTEILNRFNKYTEVYSFILRNYDSYREYLRNSW